MLREKNSKELNCLRNYVATNARHIMLCNLEVNSWLFSILSWCFSDITISSCIVKSRIAVGRKRIWRGIKNVHVFVAKMLVSLWKLPPSGKFFCTRRNHKRLDVCGMEECIKQRGVEETTQTEFPIFRQKQHRASRCCHFWWLVIIQFNVEKRKLGWGVRRISTRWSWFARCWESCEKIVI